MRHFRERRSVDITLHIEAHVIDAIETRHNGFEIPRIGDVIIIKERHIFTLRGAKEHVTVLAQRVRWIAHADAKVEAVGVILSLVCTESNDLP